MKFYLYFHSTTVLKKAQIISNAEILSVILSARKQEIDIESLLHCKMNILKVILKQYGYKLIPDDTNNKND